MAPKRKRSSVPLTEAAQQSSPAKKVKQQASPTTAVSANPPPRQHAATTPLRQRVDGSTSAADPSTTLLTTKMPSSRSITAQQERAITEFSQVTQTDKNTASKTLKANDWDMSKAINALVAIDIGVTEFLTNTGSSSFFNSSSSQQNPARSKVSAVFDTYRDDPKELKDEINFEGVGNFLGALKIDVEDIGALVLFEFVQSPQLGKITRDGFVDAFSRASADTTAKMRNVVLDRRAKLREDKTLFKNVYNHTFTLLIEDRKKAIELDQASAFWKLLFSEDGFEWNSPSAPWLDWYIEYLTSKWNKAVNKDLWRQTYAFAEASKKDESLSFWNEESSWPSVIDDFVEWVKVEKKVGGESEAMEIE